MARIFAQINTKNGLNSRADACRSFKTYGNIPTDSAFNNEFCLIISNDDHHEKFIINHTKLTAQEPRFKKFPSKSSALER